MIRWATSCLGTCKLLPYVLASAVEYICKNAGAITDTAGSFCIHTEWPICASHEWHLKFIKAYQFLHDCANKSLHSTSILRNTGVCKACHMHYLYAYMVLTVIMKSNEYYYVTRQYSLGMR